MGRYLGDESGNEGETRIQTEVVGSDYTVGNDVGTGWSGFQEYLFDKIVTTDPIKVEGEGPVKIAITSSIAGGTRFESKDNEVGTAEHFYKTERKPNVWVISGAIAYKPYGGSILYRDQMIALQNGVREPDDAAFVVKQAIGRALDELPETSQAIYVLGNEDMKNIAVIAGDLANEAGTDSKHRLVERIIRADNSIATRQGLIEATEASLKSLGEGVTGDPKLNTKIEDAKAKIWQNNEEISEYTSYRKILKELYLESLNGMTFSRAKKVQKSVEELIERVVSEEIDKKKEKLRRQNLPPEELKTLELRKEALVEEFLRPVDLAFSAEDIEKVVKETKKKVEEITAKQAELDKSAKETKKKIDETAAKLEKLKEEQENARAAHEATGKITSAIERLTKELENANARYKKLADPERIKELQKEAKTYGNTARRLDRRLQEGMTQVTRAEYSERWTQALIYINNVPVTPTQAKLIAKAAMEKYVPIMKDATGRKKNVTIQRELVKIRPIQSNGATFNLITAAPLDTISKAYKASSNSQATARLQKILENIGGAYKLDRTDTTIFVTSGSMYSSTSLDSVRDMSRSLIYTVAPGTSWDLGRLGALKIMERLRTPETQALEKGLVDSSYHEVTYDTRTMAIEHGVIDAKGLRMLRMEREQRIERDAITAILAKHNGHKESNEGENPNLEEAIINSKEPSELKDRDISRLRVGGDLEGRLRKLAPYAFGPEPETTYTIRFGAWGDEHGGERSLTHVVKATVKDAEGRDLDIIFHNGDDSGGRLANLSFVVRGKLDMPGEMLKLEERLKSSGMSQEALNAVMLDAYKKKEANDPIWNVDAQMILFTDTHIPFIGNRLVHGAIYVTTAGNHYGLTDGGYSHGVGRDEAIMKYALVYAYMKAREEDGTAKPGWEDRIILASGSKAGSSDATLFGVRTHVMHQMEKNENEIVQFISHKKFDAEFIVHSHSHQHNEVKTSDVFALQTLAAKDEQKDPYGSIISTLADNTAGYIYGELDIRITDRAIVGYRIRPVIEREFEARGMIPKQSEDAWEKFKNERYFVGSLPPSFKAVQRKNEVVAVQKNGNGKSTVKN